MVFLTNHQFLKNRRKQDFDFVYRTRVILFTIFTHRAFEIQGGRGQGALLAMFQNRLPTTDLNKLKYHIDFYYQLSFPFIPNLIGLKEVKSSTLTMFAPDFQNTV